eukprot:10605009-Ditylum_brightwellii.AAC.1
MEIINDVLIPASDEAFVQHVSTIHTSKGLGLLPSLSVEEFLDNVESFYNSRVKAIKWAKATDKGQESIFVAALDPSKFEQRD